MIQKNIGAFFSNGNVFFRVWAPLANTVELHLVDEGRYIALAGDEKGYFSTTVSGVEPGARYLYRLNGQHERPDPASCHQPEGVHGPSAVIDHSHEWSDASWTPPSLNESVFYELHVGTFTKEGAFESIIPFLAYLKDLGVTTLQLMPIAQFPGNRNWGYDGVQLYAPHSGYGGPAGLKRLVNACHEAGLAVFLDVVYNHLGPEGNYLWDFGPYFTDKYRSPWGASINLDGPYSDEVRHFFISNALYWLDVYHLDGFRLDATHALFDFSARPFLAELSEAVKNWGEDNDRDVLLIAENDQSDRRLTLPQRQLGLGMDGQWLDDLHHTLHVALTGENDGYYADYQSAALLPKVLREGFAYSGQYSTARKRRHGTSVEDLSTDRFIVSTQTHDQVGNRMLGERLSQLTDFDGLKLGACLLACSPYVPLLFMGEEYGEIAPFLYFISHGDADLVEAVRKGRAEEFADFVWAGTPPDPQAESTFQKSKLDHSLRKSDPHALLFTIYRDLLALRRSYGALSNPDRSSMRITDTASGKMICLERRDESHVFRVIMNFDTTTYHTISLDPQNLFWDKLYYSNDPVRCFPYNEDQYIPPDIFPPRGEMSVTLFPKTFVIYWSPLKKPA